MLSKIVFNEIREKRGLAYRIGADYAGFSDVYEYKVVGSVAPEVTNDIDEIVRNCISMVSSRRDLFERSLVSCIQETSMVDLSGSVLVDNVADFLGYDQRIITNQEVLDGLREVRFDHMEEAVKFLSPERQYTLIKHP